MKQALKRVFLVMLMLTMVASVVLPAAMAAEEEVVSNTNYGKLTTYGGMKTKLTLTRRGVTQSNTKYYWKTNKSSVVGVNKKGVITAKKVGTAVITATRKSNSKDVVKITVTVKRNKVNNLSSKPSASAANYQSWILRLKSVEIIAPSKVAVEYYIACNFPSNWRADKLNYMEDAINLYRSGSYVKTIVGDDYQLMSTNISGFKARWGRSVQVAKVFYEGSRVNAVNTKLSNFNVYNSTNARGSLRYTYTN